MIGTWRGVILAAALPLLAAAAALPAQAQEALGEGMTIYMQMGGNPGRRRDAAAHQRRARRGRGVRGRRTWSSSTPAGCPSRC